MAPKNLSAKPTWEEEEEEEEEGRGEEIVVKYHITCEVGGEATGTPPSLVVAYNKLHYLPTCSSMVGA